MIYLIRQLVFFLILGIGLVECVGEAHAQTWQNAEVLPTNAVGSAYANSLVADGAGGYLLAGNFSGTLTLDSFVLTSAGDQDIFVAHRSATGTWTQAVRAGGTGRDNLNALAVDATGLATLVGSFASSSIAFGSTTLLNADTSASPSTDLFVARLSATGAWTQAVRAGSPSDDAATRLALDPNGTAVIGGTFIGNTLSLGSYTLQNNVAAGAPFVARLSSTGTWLQAVALQSSGGPIYLGELAVDTKGTVVVSGATFLGSQLTFGSYTLPTPNTRGNVLFIARLNRGGTWVQAVQANASDGTPIPRHLVLDAAGNVVVAGDNTGSSTQFGSFIVASPHDASGQGAHISFVARLSAAGTWTQVAQAVINPGSPPNSYQSNYINALALDTSGNVWVGGQFVSSSLTLGAITLTNSDPNSLQNIHFDGYVARLSSSGTWSFAIPASSASPTALLLDGSRVLVAGGLGTTATFGPFVITAAAKPACFLASLGGGVLATAASSSGPFVGIAAPNPAQASTIFTTEPAATPRTVQLLDVLGREVRHFKLPAQATSGQLDLVGLPGGTYLLRCGPAMVRLAIE